MTRLSAEDFGAFLEGAHGVAPYPWQERLAQQVIETGGWPSVLDLPTGVGKTTAIDIALFHLAVDLESGMRTQAPVRIAFVVDRRIVVDDAHARAERMKRALENPSNAVVARAAELLGRLAGPDAPPLVVRALRGGIPREDDWARSPVQPTILCSTVDQVGSRLLFRGYGVSDSMKPVHAGLLGSDCLILLDEAHIAEPFRQTLEWVRLYRGPRWRRSKEAAPWGVTLLTATPGSRADDAFGLDPRDHENPRLQRVLQASKPTRLVEGRSRRGELSAEWQASGLGGRIRDLAQQVTAAREHFAAQVYGDRSRAIGVVVNRVTRARALHSVLEVAHPDADVVLLIGPSRPVERGDVVRRLDPIRTGAGRALERTLIIVATQCIEVGVDIDLDALITEAAPLDALRQRFGRLNRAGRDVEPWAAIVACREELARKYEDPIYGTAIRTAWEQLMARAGEGAEPPVVDFGILGFNLPMEAGSLTRKDDAPVLLPRHVELLQQTSPRPLADPEVGFYLHGVRREPDAVSIVWRAEVERALLPDASVSALLAFAPPRAAEAITLPVWTVRRWLSDSRGPSEDDLADSPGAAPDEEPGEAPRERAFRWTGSEEGSGWIRPSEIRPGDTLVVSSRLGGLDRFGWFPERSGANATEVLDVGTLAARPFAGRRMTVRVHPSLVEQALRGLGGEAAVEAEPTEASTPGRARVWGDFLADTLAAAEDMAWPDVVRAVLALGLEETLLGEELELLHSARGGHVECWFDVYPRDGEGRPGGVIFVAPRGVEDRGPGAGDPSTEDDLAGSFAGRPVPLDVHLDSVQRRAEAFAVRLPDARLRDIALAARLHDVGKADLRFQRWMHFGDPLGPDPDDPGAVLAKSGRVLPRKARGASGLPDKWRHEALSVRLAVRSDGLKDAADPELVLWLIGTHHGYGRPFFPHADPDDARDRPIGPVFDLPRELPAGAGPQSLGWEWHAQDWARLAEAVTERYGAWQLAAMEAVLRLADHRASADDENGGIHGT